MNPASAMTKERITTTPPPQTVQNKQWFTTLTNDDHVLYISCMSETIAKFWTWHDNALLKRSCKHTCRFSTQAQHTKPARVQVATQTSYLLCPPLLQVTPTSADIFLNMVLTTLPKHSLWTSFRHSNIFWHSWHIFDQSLWHILSDLLVDLSCDILQLLLWHTLSATTTNRGHHRWGPARHTELIRSRLGSSTPHWTQRIPVAIGVQHATLNTQYRGWGPARHTELAISRLGSDMPHWTHRIATGQGDGRRRGGEGGEGGRGRGGGEETDIKSNNPHLTGGE